MTNTCGQGLAHHSTLPRLMADVVFAVAGNLEAHLEAIDPVDEGSRPEREAYVALLNEHRGIAERLRALAAKMAGCVDLPMARHNAAAMESENARLAFVELIARERVLVALLQLWIEQHEQMIGTSRSEEES